MGRGQIGGKEKTGFAKQPLHVSELWLLGRAKDRYCEGGSWFCIQVCLYAKCSIGNTELIVKRLGRKIATAQDSSFLAFNQIEGWQERLREEQVFKGLHFNHTLIGEYYSQKPLCYLGSLPKPNGVILATGKLSTSQWQVPSPTCVRFVSVQEQTLLEGFGPCRPAET